MLWPAGTGAGEAGLVSARLAEVLRAVVSIPVLAGVSGSVATGVVPAVLEMLAVREESTFTTRVTDLLAPEVIVVRFQPTTPAVSVPPLERSEERRVARECSGRLAPVASDGQGLVTVGV